MKKQNGITLIALVITIIVLLILAGVSIAMLTGDNGILTKAKGANETTLQAEVEESIKLGLAEILADKLDPTIPDTDKPVIDASTITTKMTRNNANIGTNNDAKIKVTVEEIKGGTPEAVTAVKVTYAGKDKNYIWTINPEGKLTGPTNS